MAFVLTLLYIATALLSPGVFPEGAADLHINLLLGVLIILTAVWSLEESKLGSLPDGFLCLGLLFATVLSTLATGWLGGALTTFMEFVPILLTFFFVAITCNTLRRVKVLVFVLFIVMAFVLTQGALADHYGINPSPYLYTEVVTDGSTLYRYRGMGMIGDPNDLAQVLVTVIPLLFLRWKKGQTTTNFLFSIVPASILAAGIFFTHSRGGTLALVAVILFGFKDKLSVYGSAIVAGLAMVGMLALNVGGGRGMDQDDGTRVAFWGTGLQLLKHHPIFGVGYNNFPDLNGGRTAHNSFILAMVELGFLGYFFWIGMIVSSWSGLSQMVCFKAKAAKEKARVGLTSSRSRMSNETPSAVSQLTTVAVGAVPFSTRSADRRDVQSISNTVAAYSPSSRLSAADSMKGDAPSEDELARAALLVRTAFVGMLTAGFFLSRTYAIILYIMLGIAVCVIRLSSRPVSLDMQTLSKRTVLIVLGSVVGMYIFVRLHGAG